MSETEPPSLVQLVHPLYLDVPMMTSFLAAIEDGIAYGSSVKLIQATQRQLGTAGEAEAGIPSLGILSSVLNLSLRGKIEKNQTTDDNEEVEQVRKHTEASLFMRLRSILQEDKQIIVVNDDSDLSRVEHGSLVEATGQIFRSPAGEALDAAFRVMSMLGLRVPEEAALSSQKQGGRQGGRQSQPQMDALEELTQALERPTSDFLLRFMHRLRDDLTKSKIVDVVMKLPNSKNLSIVIAVSSEFLHEGDFEHLLSGQYTVLGKATRVLRNEGMINLYSRSTLSSLLGEKKMQEAVDVLQENFVNSDTKRSEHIFPPAIQLIPLAIFV